MSRLDVLDRIQKKVLWLGTYMVHHANSLRPNPDGVKVGGHQASSSSIVSLLTALYFDALRPDDLVAVKAHASPAFYAIQYLRGRLPAAALRELRTFGGLQAYPSRRKNADVVDLSTGSMGLGAVQAMFGALASRYVVDHFGGERRRGRVIVIVGDAELDEGNVAEALAEDVVGRLSNVLWIVDVNRQSLDRIVPDGRLRQMRAMFEAGGWRVTELRWGKKLQSVFDRRGGERLRERLQTHDEHRVPAPAPAAVRRRAQGPRHDRRRGDRPHARPAALRHERCRARGARRRRRRPRSPAARRGARLGRAGGRPPVGHLRQHDQGLGASARRRSAQSHRAPHPGPDRRAARSARHRRGRGVGRVCARQRGSPARRHAAAALQAAVPEPGAGRGARRARRELSDGMLDPGGVRPRARRAEPAAGRGSHRDRVGRRRHHHAPRGVDQPQGRLLSRGAPEPVRRRAAGRPVEGVAGRPAHRARHRRAQPVPAAGRPRALARDPRRDLAADRHALRSLRHARARRALPRPLFGVALRRGGDAIGRHALSPRAAPISR